MNSLNSETDYFASHNSWYKKKKWNSFLIWNIYYQMSQSSYKQTNWNPCWLWGQSPWLSAVRECVTCTEFLRGKLTCKGWRISNFLTLRIPLSLDEQESCNDLPIFPFLRPQRNGCVVWWGVPQNSLDLKGMDVETSTTSKEKGRKKMSGLSIKSTASVQLGEGHPE